VQTAAMAAHAAFFGRSGYNSTVQHYSRGLTSREV